MPIVRKLSDEWSIRQSKKLSQNFLIDERVLDREAVACEVKGKAVLEVGPGFGFLTERLLYQGAKKVVAIEKDTRIIPLLEERFGKEIANKKLQLIHSDFLDCDFTKENNEFDVVASNVPYSISSLFLFKLPELKFNKAILCLQKEFIERMLAKPGEKEYSRLSVGAQANFKINRVFRVPRSAFYPIPGVDSAVIELIPTGNGLSKEEEKLIALMFQHRKKTLRAAMADASEELGIEKTVARERAEKSRLGERRIFTLTRDEFKRILI